MPHPHPNPPNPPPEPPVNPPGPPVTPNPPNEQQVLIKNLKRNLVHKNLVRRGIPRIQLMEMLQTFEDSYDYQTARGMSPVDLIADHTLQKVAAHEKTRRDKIRKVKGDRP